MFDKKSLYKILLMDKYTFLDRHIGVSADDERLFRLRFSHNGYAALTLHENLRLTLSCTSDEGICSG